MAYNKVVYDGQTLIDLTDLNVTASDVMSGVTFILADGTKAVGTLQSEIFWATYGVTTNAEIETAYQNGKDIFCRYNDRTYRLYDHSSSTEHTFTAIYISVGYRITCKNDSWTNGVVYFITSSTSTPTANTVAKFDSNANMNSSDMSAQEVNDFVDGLNTSVGDYVQRSELADSVVEQGTENGWYYRKWVSGYIEASIFVASPTLGTASTVNGVTRQAMTIPTPPTMVTKYDINASGTNSGCWVAYGFDSLENPAVFVHRVSGSAVPSNISITIKGTWK